jgi:hypothetical protein
VIDENVVPRKNVLLLPFAVAQNHVQSICSFLDVHYETLALDFAVSNYKCCSSYQLSSQLEPIVRVDFLSAGVAIIHCPLRLGPCNNIGVADLPELLTDASI